MAPGVLELPRVSHQCGLAGQVQPGGGVGGVRWTAADEPSGDLAEIQGGRDRGGVDPDAQAWQIDAFADHVDGDEPGCGARCEPLEGERRRGIVGNGEGGDGAGDRREEPGEGARVALGAGDNQPAGLGGRLPCGAESLMGGGQDGGLRQRWAQRVRRMGLSLLNR